MTITRTHTRTHTEINFANPYLRCDQCKQPVPAWHDGHACGCGDGAWNEPCGHKAGTTSICPSWSPVDGCQCKAQLGNVDHEPADQTELEVDQPVPIPCGCEPRGACTALCDAKRSADDASDTRRPISDAACETRRQQGGGVL